MGIETIVRLRTKTVSAWTGPWGKVLKALAVAIPAIVLLVMAFYHLTAFPLTWFDEGSHLHVPKTLVTEGVYADISSEGFRYYGPTLGVGPTVMLPIAAVFRLFGIGLLQARAVIALYLLASAGLFFRLALSNGNRRFAWVATALLVTSPIVSFIEYGRQVIGEVPGLFFILGGLLVWFKSWEKPSWLRLGAAGLLLGLAVVTKNQYLIFLAPAVALIWLANRLHYRLVGDRIFFVPGAILLLCYLVWEIILLLVLGPATAAENFKYLKEAAQGAALVFSPALMGRALGELLSYRAYFCLLIPALLCGCSLAFPRSLKGMRWGALLALAGLNLGWYVVASIGWTRYVFVGAVISSLFVAQLFSDVTGNFSFGWFDKVESFPRTGLRWAMGIWLVVMILVPLARTAKTVIFPPVNTPVQMASYLDSNVSKTAIIETWEPEMGFLTEHRYHFVPQALLNQAVGYIWLEKNPPAQNYPVSSWNTADFVLVGEFARWVQIYPMDALESRYRLVTRVGTYELYEQRK